jgi:putative ABC transport system permease protein
MDLRTFVEFRRHTSSFSELGVGLPATMTLGGRRDGPIRLQGFRASPAMFPMLGVQPALGRRFEVREETPGFDDVIIVSHQAWQRYFDGRADILGQTAVLDDRSYSVIGVMPRGFQYPNPQSDFWIPFALPDPDPFSRVTITGRVKDGVSMQAATADVRTTLARLRDDVAPDGSTSRFDVVSVQDELVAPVRPGLRILAVAVVAVLLIASVNVANLMLARTASREREIAVRRALGANRARLVRHVLAESVVLGVAGGAAGIGLAFGGVELVRALGASVARPDLGSGVSIPRLDEIGIDAGVVVFTALLSITTGLIFGIVPALHESRAEAMNVLREGATSGVSGFSRVGRYKLQGALIVTEICLAMMLLVGGVLLISSFVKLATVNRGYDQANVLTFQVGPPQGAFAPPTFPEELTARLRTLPRVRAAGYAGALPMIQVVGSVPVRTTRQMASSAGQPYEASLDARLPPERPNPRYVSRDFLTVMGTRVLAGRGFGDNDRAGQVRVMLVNETLARSGVLGSHPIGTLVYAIGPEPWEIVGIVEDTRDLGLDRDANPQFFIDCRQVPGLFGPGGLDRPYYAVRMEEGRHAGTLAADIRALVRQLDARAVVDNVATMEQLVSNSLSRRRMYTVVLGAFAAVAVALAVVGIYGVIAYCAAQRRREIGIRMALGASRGRILRLVLGQTAALGMTGIAAGLAGAAMVTRYLEGMLFGLTPLDTSTFIAAPLVFLIVGTVAALLPAWSATMADPVRALRAE